MAPEANIHAPGQPGNLMSNQDPRDRPGGYSGGSGDPQRPGAKVGSGREDGGLPVGRGARGRRARAGRPVSQAVGALGSVSAHPAVGSLAGDAELFGDVSDRAALSEHPIDEQEPSPNGQTSVDV